MEVRSSLVAALEADLVGPFALAIPGTTELDALASTELLQMPPSRWYFTGFLAPRRQRGPDKDDLDSLGGEFAAGSDSQADDAGSEEPEPARPILFPASMGLSVYLPPEPTAGSDSIEVELTYADYEPIEIKEEGADGPKRFQWKRIPHGPIRFPVELDAKALEHGVSVPDSVGLKIVGELRSTSMEGLGPKARVLSLWIVNDRIAEDRERDRSFIFQVRLTLHYARGFLPRPNRRGEDIDSEEEARTLALLFRDRKEWAVGHNTSILKPEPDANGVVRTLRTTQLPRCEIPDVEHRKLDGLTLGMAELAKHDPTALQRALAALPEQYSRWLESQRSRSLERSALEPARDGLMQKAAECHKRINEGIALLARDDTVREAFSLANQVMHVAAKRLDLQREDKRYGEGRQPEWRPFQLAFVLMALPSVADPRHAHRLLADMIYFPTGGGKTEAYLGLVAFTLILRRLRGTSRPDAGRGVAVILRYTLRLLTLDQLGRAATLICALEELRHRHPDKLGNTRFSIGLWVGRGTTANRLREVHEALNDFAGSRNDSPFPLSKCPWCGEALRIENVKLLDENGLPSKTHFVQAAVYCAQAECAFTEAKRPARGLPVLFVDEQIYQELPEFLVATVDKFAMMPWRSEVGMLFGRATHISARRAYGVTDRIPKSATELAEGLLPPELIIQDELHLISGPLGTMVGLYEAAIDYLCERQVDGLARAPKVVCSTATVRRAKEQIRALFGREMSLFPPRGIDQGDNFFAAPAALNRKPGRLYVGVGAPGRALRAVSVRTYATLLAAAQKAFDPTGPAEQPGDPYMTLVGYFNSLRELGGMRRLVEDEVRNRVQVFADEKRPLDRQTSDHPWAANRRLREPAELTSRESTERVKDTKARLATRQISEEGKALDVVLASSMISVGLDIDRLGLMVVAGQPKTTSEYIQATSRVGRSYPGLVVTCLHLIRPRDRSHYERFHAYHESFYREVEATSVTPFSHQTLDRGLVGTYLSMIRHSIADMSRPTGAMEIHPQRPTVERVLEKLVARARHHRSFRDRVAEDRLADYVSRRGKSFLDAWERVIDAAIKGAATRQYSPLDSDRVAGKPLLYTATDEPPIDKDECDFLAPTSMRDVEPSVHVWVRFKQLDER
jgi:Helicase conserved C-terminal domain